MAIRPNNLAEFIGQEKIKKQLMIEIEASKLAGEPLKHILLYGPPGTGKTSLAQAIANEMQCKIFATTATAIQDLESVIVFLSQIPKTGIPPIVFIDEIHRLPLVVEEAMYKVLEDFEMDYTLNYGGDKIPLTAVIPKFTMIGATTSAGLLTKPFRDRFPLHFHLDVYTPRDLVLIIETAFQKMATKYTKDSLAEIATRAKGTPRIAINLAERIKNYAMVKTDGVVTKKIALEAFELLGIDDLGLTEQDYKVLEYLAANGKPVGLKSLASALNEDLITLETVIEPYLVHIGFIVRSPRGRTISEKGMRWLLSKNNRDIIFF